MPKLGVLLPICIYTISTIIKVVVSSGSFHAFYVISFPLKYVPSIPPRSAFVIVNGFNGFRNKEDLYHISSFFSLSAGQVKP